MAIELRGASGYLYADCQDEEVLLEGRAGTGKTIGAMKKLVDVCFRFPGSRHLLCRQTRKSMTDTTLVTLESVIGENSPEVTRVSREQRHSYRLNSSEIVCAGLDEPSKAFGSAWGLVVLEEAIEASLDSWELFGRAARDPRLNRSGHKSFPYHQFIAITNPGSPSHWLNKRASPCPDGLLNITDFTSLENLHTYNRTQNPSKMRRLVSVHQDNPAYFDLDSWGWTLEGTRYIQRLKSSMSGHNLARMFDGRWTSASGGVFAGDFQHARNVINPWPNGPPSGWPVWVYFDPGRDHPCAANWFTIAPSGKKICFHEIHARGMALEEVAAEIKRYNHGAECYPLAYFMDPYHGFKKTFESTSTIAEQFQRHGLQFMEAGRFAGKGFEASVENVRGFLRDGTLLFTRDCVRTIEELETWSYKRLSSGETPAGDDAYENIGDDAIDNVRRFCAAGHKRDEIVVPDSEAEARQWFAEQERIAAAGVGGTIEDGEEVNALGRE